MRRKCSGPLKACLGKRSSRTSRTIVKLIMDLPSKIKLYFLSKEVPLIEMSNFYNFKTKDCKDLKLRGSEEL